MSANDDLRPPRWWPIQATIDAWRAQPRRDYVLTRWLILRLLGVVYVFAFLGLVIQARPLLGSHGLTPIADLVTRGRLDFVDVPSLFVWWPSDTAIAVASWIGLALSIALALGYANVASIVLLWIIYGSFVRVGQMWFSFGWEIQLLETTLLAACLVHPWDPRPLASRAPPRLAIVLMRWLVFRIFLGAGLIKLRGAMCWTDLTCLDAHFETQPIPNPLSPLFHGMPHAVHAVGVAFNHVVELLLPWCVFGPRFLRLAAFVAMAGFQMILVASGNLAFLNWLTLVPLLALLDDAILWLTPRRLAAWLRRRIGTPAPPRLRQKIAIGLVAVLVAGKSCAVIDNLMSSDQRMNSSFDRLALVNTYGAFGSIDFERHELVIEGTRDGVTWLPYELPCKPGDLARRPCVLGPYHLRLDWLIWFAAMGPPEASPWLLHVAWKLLDGDVGIRALFATDPFDGAAPALVRIRRFAYHLQPYGAPTWWTRDGEELWLPPTSLDTDGLAEELARHHWPSDTAR